MAGVYDIEENSDFSASTTLVGTLDNSRSGRAGLQRVILSSDAFHFCMTQCLSTEVEEVMGLLIGEVDDKNGICHVTHSLPLKRLDKRKDRVEIGTEQLGLSIDVADQLSADRRRQKGLDGQLAESLAPLTVVGWYHSHPHITVFPSDVDIMTHDQYQSSMSKFWLGLIFGVFNYEEAKSTNRFQLIAFQSAPATGYGRSNGAGGGRLQHVIIPIEIESRGMPKVDQWALKKAATLIDLLLEEEKEAFQLNQGTGKARSEQIGRHHNACVYSKAIAKIIALLGAPMIDAMKGRRKIKRTKSGKK